MIHPNQNPKAASGPMSRRQCLGLLAAGIVPATTLPGCALVNTESPYWATVAAVGGTSHEPPVSRAQSDALPYASILAWYEGSPYAFMVLGEIGADRTLFYYSQSRQILATRGPFIVQTVGMPGDVSRTLFPEPTVPDLRSLVGQEMVRRIDIQSAALFEIPVRSRFSRRGSERVTILEREYELEVIQEDAEMRGEKPYRNLYWIDPRDGFCWKSRQHIHARSPAVNIEITKPAA